MMLGVLAGSAQAYIRGNVSGVTGPGGYSGTKLDLVIGSDSFSVEPILETYGSDDAVYGGETYRTFTLRAALEKDKYAVGALAGMTPEVNDYSNKFFGGDITLTLTPGSGGKSRLAGPGSRAGSGGGKGVSRVDVGAGFKYTLHTQTIANVDKETGQAEGSLFAGAKVLMVNLAGSYTGYTYGDEDANAYEFVPGHNFITIARPKSSVNIKLDLPGQPLVTPYISYTATKYKAVSGQEAPDSSAYLFGAYLDFDMITANVGYQIFDQDGKKSFISLGAGIKF